MSLRPSKGWLWLLLPASAGVLFLGATLYFYRGSYTPPPSAKVATEQITLPSLASSSRAPSEAVVLRAGVLLIDNIHNNAFDVEELDTLDSKVAGRGYDIQFMVGRDVRFPRIPPLTLLEQQLRKADSFAVVLPTIGYDAAEVELVKRFVSKGGRLLLIGDPTRSHQANSLADAFGLLFQTGYLYNVVDHDLNFRNIFVRDFRPDQVTEGLEAIALYTAGSIKSTGPPLALADTNTFSSRLERIDPFTPIVKGTDGNVLAIADLTFLTPPWNTSLDNARLISNIADFLTSGERTFDLVDFPHFFNDKVDILLGVPDLFDMGAQLKGLLSDLQVPSAIQSVEDPTKDTVFFGLYRDSLTVAQYLDVAGVGVDGTLRTPFTPDVATEGTGLVLLHEGRDRRVMLIMADGLNGLESMLGRLQSGVFRDGLVSNLLGVYRTP